MDKKYKKIISVLFWVFILTIIAFDVDKYIPNFYIFLGSFLLFLYILDIYKSIKYLKNTPENEIRIRSYNDNYYNFLPFIFGIIFCSFSILSFFKIIIETEKTTLILLLIIGIINLFKGFYFVPTALIKVKKEILCFENEKVKKDVEIEQIENIILTNNNITLNLKNNKKYILSNLELKQNDIEKTIFFFNKYYNGNVEHN